MKKNKVFVIEEQEKKEIYLSTIIEFILGIFAYAIILIIASNTFRGFYVGSFGWAVLAALIISFLNITIKPFLVFLTLPITVSTLGIFYPVINIIILKITGLLLGIHFSVNGFWVPFFMAIFISILRIMFDTLLIKPIMEGVKR